MAGPEEAERVIARPAGRRRAAGRRTGRRPVPARPGGRLRQTRLQFGRPIRSFRRSSTSSPTLLVDLEHARSAAYHAVWALTDGTDDPAVATSIAQAVASAAFNRIARTIQVLGGIGSPLGTPGAPVLQTRQHRRSPARLGRGAPDPAGQSRCSTPRRPTGRRGSPPTACDFGAIPVADRRTMHRNHSAGDDFLYRAVDALLADGSRGASCCAQTDPQFLDLPGDRGPPGRRRGPEQGREQVIVRRPRRRAPIHPVAVAGDVAGQSLQPGARWR